MRYFRTDHQEHGRETQRGSHASSRLRALSQRGACSPRGAVAFSALSARVRLREKMGDLAQWMMTVRTSSPVRCNAHPALYSVKWVIHSCGLFWRSRSTDGSGHITD